MLKTASPARQVNFKSSSDAVSIGNLFYGYATGGAILIDSTSAGDAHPTV